MTEPSNAFLSPRWWNIGLRTAHIATMGILLGGHAYDVPKAELEPALWWCVGSGVALSAIEAGPRLVWFHQVRGLMVIAKIGMICLVPFFWGYRLPILITVVVIACVGSHMSARFRYYSVLHREIIKDGCGPGVGRLEEDIS